MSQNLTVTSTVDQNNNLAFQDSNSGQLNLILKAGGAVDIPAGAVWNFLTGSTLVYPPGQTFGYIPIETGANNALAVAYLDSYGTPIALLPGLRMTIQLAHSLQAGANTLSVNGGAALPIKSEQNPANNIVRGYAANGVIQVLYNGTAWLDLSQ